MIGANKAEEMAANTAEVAWLAPVAASDADSQTSSAVQGLLSPGIKQWMMRAKRAERKAPQWHVRRPVHQQLQGGPPPAARRAEVAPPGGRLAALTTRVT